VDRLDQQLEVFERGLGEHPVAEVEDVTGASSGPPEDVTCPFADELAGTENRLAVERKRYNEAVQQYNSDVRGIPGSWWARIGGFPAQKDYFKAQASSREVPKVSFQ